MARKEADCRILGNQKGDSDCIAIARWMKDFAKFERKAAADVGYDWQANIRLYVTDDTWLDISETLLMPEDRTDIGEPPNDWAVRCFLRERGPYRGYAKKLCESYYTNALTPFKMVTWPIGNDLDHLSAVYEYISSASVK